MSNKYIIIFYVPSYNDEFDDVLDKYLRNKPYKHVFIDNGVQKLRRIDIININDHLVNKVKEDFIGIYKDHPKREQMRFQVMSQDDYAV